MWFAARARQFDDKLRAYISAHPHASVVNLGAGLDTAFYRVDMGQSNGTTSICRTSSLCANSCCRKLTEYSTLQSRCLTRAGAPTSTPSIILSSYWRAVFWFFEEAQVKHFLSSLADALAGAQLACDANSKLGASIINRSLQNIGMTGVAVTWRLEDARVITQWDSRLKLIDQTLLYSIHRDSTWGEQTLKNMDLLD